MNTQVGDLVEACPTDDIKHAVASARIRWARAEREYPRDIERFGIIAANRLLDEQKAMWRQTVMAVRTKQWAHFTKAMDR